MNHKPVLSKEVIENIINPEASNGIYIDCTFGAGGYTKALLEYGIKNNIDINKIYCVDQDLEVLKYWQAIEANFPRKTQFIHANFKDLNQELDQMGITQVHGMMFDLGVSSMQIDEPERGFSFQKPAKLDMRMDVNGSKISAYDFVNNAKFDELADIIYYYGNETYARAIARAIIKKRDSSQKIETTSELADIVKSVVGHRGKSLKDGGIFIHPATKTFQAIRIHINSELDALLSGMQNLLTYLAVNGKMIIVTFHSLEDKIVKNFFQSMVSSKTNEHYKLIEQDFFIDHKFTMLKNIIVPSDEEVKNNIRARSGKMRVLERIL